MDKNDDSHATRIAQKLLQHSVFKEDLIKPKSHAKMEHFYFLCK